MGYVNTKPTSTNKGVIAGGWQRPTGEQYAIQISEWRKTQGR